jgi:hypothetical protein
MPHSIDEYQKKLNTYLNTNVADEVAHAQRFAQWLTRELGHEKSQRRALIVEALVPIFQAAEAPPPDEHSSSYRKQMRCLQRVTDLKQHLYTDAESVAEFNWFQTLYGQASPILFFQLRHPLKQDERLVDVRCYPCAPGAYQVEGYLHSNWVLVSRSQRAIVDLLRVVESNQNHVSKIILPAGPLFAVPKILCRDLQPLAAKKIFQLSVEHAHRRIIARAHNLIQLMQPIKKELQQIAIALLRNLQKQEIIISSKASTVHARIFAEISLRDIRSLREQITTYLTSINFELPNQSFDVQSIYNDPNQDALLANLKVELIDLREKLAQKKAEFAPLHDQGSLSVFVDVCSRNRHIAYCCPLGESERMMQTLAVEENDQDDSSEINDAAITILGQHLQKVKEALKTAPGHREPSFWQRHRKAILIIGLFVGLIILGVAVSLILHACGLSPLAFVFDKINVETTTALMTYLAGHSAIALFTDISLCVVASYLCAGVATLLGFIGKKIVNGFVSCFCPQPATIAVESTEVSTHHSSARISVITFPIDQQDALESRTARDVQPLLCNDFSTPFKLFAGCLPSGNRSRGSDQEHELLVSETTSVEAGDERPSTTVMTRPATTVYLTGN